MCPRGLHRLAVALQNLKDGLKLDARGVPLSLLAHRGHPVLSRRSYQTLIAGLALPAVRLFDRIFGSALFVVWRSAGWAELNVSSSMTTAG